jgi:hypothetical protein
MRCSENGIPLSFLNSFRWLHKLRPLKTDGELLFVFVSEFTCAATIPTTTRKTLNSNIDLSTISSVFSAFDKNNKQYD